MTRLMIEVPDEVAATLADRAKAAGHATAEAFLAAWACEKWGQAPVSSRQELEAKLMEAIDSGPSQPATREDWEAIRREGQARIAALRGKGGDVARVVLRSPTARREAVQFYIRFALEESGALADRFLAALEATYGRVAAMPGIGAAIEGLPARLTGTRCLSVDGFPNHLVFYRETPHDIEILRILHAARDLTAALVGEEPD